VFGFWILLALLPMIAEMAGSRSWMLALPLAAILFAWNRYPSQIIRYALRSTRIADQALVSRFAELAGKCSIPPPLFERVNLHGGAVANAIALASLRESAVLFSDTLLDRLERDEAGAICAHELAHLEYFNPARLRRLRLANDMLIGLAAGTAVAAPMFSPLLQVAWMAILLAALVWRARNRQRNETVSDRRAVELTGDGEALVRALTKLYLFARIPRRLDPEMERRATHPSLARRIRDIRRAAGAAPAALEAGASFTSADGRVVAAFERDRLEWREGDAATHCLKYGYLSELRVRAQRSGPAQLVAVEASGRKWELTLAADDLARAQEVLDVVDGYLADPPQASRRSPRLAQAAAVLTALAALVLAQLSLFVVAVLAAAQPASSLVGGAGLASLAVAGVMLRQTGLAAMAYPSWIAVIPAALGLLLILFARRARDDEERPRPLFGATLAVLVVFALVPLALGGFDAVGLHDSSRSNAAAVILLMALSGALAFRRTRAHRYAAVGPAALAGVIAFAGSTTFLEAFARDPFLVRAEPIPLTIVGQVVSAEFSIPFFVTQLRLSPTGRHVIVVPEAEADDVEATTFRVGRAGGILAPVTAHDVVFTDDDHVLVAQTERDGITMRLVSADPLSDVWQQHVPDLREVHLLYSPGTNRWRLVGRDDQQQIVRAEGVVGVPGVERTAWPAPEETGSIEAIATAGDRALISEAHYPAGPLQRSRLLWRWAWLLQPPQRESRLWTTGSGGRVDLAVSRLGTRCVDGALGDDSLVCSAFDGSDTRFIAIDPASGQTTPVGTLRGQMIVYHAASAGWVSGWADAMPIALRLSTRQAFRAADPQNHITHITAADHVAGTVSFDGTRSLVRLYAID
jgi:Zn-dependent protease with chaperone function